ncbi:ras-related and estrogen-regulated growth inhibitor-like protein [Tetranychus urticae]|nr:ras-related and estrogen-regulated growth inhibitor-like protein [Tetranychus urticae]
MKSLRILLLGAKSVGKSAIAVRFLTKRYIGEYQTDCDILYKQTINCDDALTNIEILDFSRHSQEQDVLTNYDDLKDQIIWAQAYMIVYSICDEPSFVKAQQYVKLICKLRGLTSLQAPMVLLGNKRDLEVGRKVNLEEGRNIAYKFGTQFYEISAAENFVGVTLAFHGLIREARSLFERFSGTTMTYQPGQAIKKLSLNSVTRAFGAVFGGKNSPGSSQYYTIIRDGRVSLSNEGSTEDKHRRSNSISQSNGNPGLMNSCKQKKEIILETAHKRSPPIASL